MLVLDVFDFVVLYGALINIMLEHSVHTAINCLRTGRMQ